MNKIEERNRLVTDFVNGKIDRATLRDKMPSITKEEVEVHRVDVAQEAKKITDEKN